MEIKTILFWIILVSMALFALALVLPALKKNKFTLFFIALSLPTLSFTLYLLLGNSKALTQSFLREKQQMQVQRLKAELGTPEAVIQKMKAHLRAHPDSARGWFLLGRLYAATQQFLNAREAFIKADHLKPHDQDTLLQLTQTLNLLAIHAYHAHQYDLAIHYWKEILHYYPDNLDAQRALFSVIHHAEAAKIELPVQITLHPSLQSHIFPHSTLFVYAKEAKGSPIPLAVMQTPIPTFPKEVILNGGMSMDSSHELKKGMQVVIVARISKSGQAMPQSGDLQGTSRVISLGSTNKKITLMIDHALEGNAS